jgi:hypothetical protein
VDKQADKIPPHNQHVNPPVDRQDDKTSPPAQPERTPADSQADKQATIATNPPAGQRPGKPPSEEAKPNKAAQTWKHSLNHPPG